MSTAKHYVHLHFIVILLGFTAILGALITIPAANLVWFRMFFAFLGLWLFLLWQRIPLMLTGREIARLMGIGIVVALHWITFFHAIKVSNVSVTLGVFASVTFFTSLLEPLLLKRRVFWLEVVIGLITIGGIYLIFRYEFRFVEGIVFSLISAFLNGLFVVLNRNISSRYHHGVISFYEMLGGFLFITVFFLITGQLNLQSLQMPLADLGYILVLSLVCTSYAFMAIIHILKKLSAYTVMLAINMEPVYGILMAWLFFPETEKMTGGFYLGASIIILAVVGYPFLKRKFLKEKG
ncbi:MAG TPA: DMT family transporter [Bacteroidales bacterium]|nr:DMT family transporter [Bacteroidales bacterium]